jgi:hypothetical protein
VGCCFQFPVPLFVIWLTRALLRDILAVIGVLPPNEDFRTRILLSTYRMVDSESGPQRVAVHDQHRTGHPHFHRRAVVAKGGQTQRCGVKALP